MPQYAQTRWPLAQRTACVARRGQAGEATIVVLLHGSLESVERTEAMVEPTSGRSLRR